MQVVSPLTGTTDVTEVDRIAVETIAQRYAEDFELDVASYFKGLKEIQIYKCNKTLYKFYYPLFIEADSRFYELLMYNRIVYYPVWRWENSIAAKFITDNDKVLDVGCGDGGFLRGLLARKKVKAEGLELNPEALAIAKRDGLPVHNISVQKYSKDNPNQYDVVTSFQVLEHIADVKSFLSAKIDLLKSGGLLIIGVPFNNPYLYRKDKFHTLNLPPHHMGLWNEESLINLTKLFDLSVVSYEIEKVDNMVYYLFIQLNRENLYRRLSNGSSFFRLFTKAFNKIFKISSKIIRGRNIVIVYKKG